MRILFAGTPHIAVPSLRTLAEADDIEVTGVLTAPDKVSGRGRKLSPSPVKAAALEYGLPVLQPPRLGADARKETSELGADLLVVFAYGRIFGPKFLDLFPRGGINMHPSALPLYRGPAPITAAILDGVSRTALTVQNVALEMDAGDIIRQTPYALDGSETTATLTADVAEAAAPELLAAVRDIEAGRAEPVPQNHSEATYCTLISKDDGRIAWTQSAAGIERLVRACLPWPKATTSLDGEGLVILESTVADDSKTPDESVIPGTVLGVDKSRGILVQTGQGILAVSRLQLAARKPLDFKSFLNGVAVDTGTVLGDVNES